MRKNLNTVLLLVAILILAYIAFLKPTPQRFVNARGYRDLLLDTATGRLCDARTPAKEAIKRVRQEIKRIEALPAPPLGFVLAGQKTPLDKAWDHLKRLLHPSKRYPLCSEL